MRTLQGGLRALCRRQLAVLGSLACMALAGCGSLPTAPDPSTAGAVAVLPEAGPIPDPLRMQIIFTAMQQVGVPYQWGGTGPRGFDCSGLVQYAFRNAGLSMPRTAAEQLAATRPVSLEEAEAGDLLFFRDQGRTSHVAIYLGDGRFVHAPRTGKTVSLESFANSHWRSRFTRAGRVEPF